MHRFLHILYLICFTFFVSNTFAQLNNNCANAVNICNNQLAEKLDDGPGTQECPSGGCGCMLAGEKNSRWFRITIQNPGTLEFTIRPYNGTADYDFSVWNVGVGGSCPSGAALSSPDRCNFASPRSPTGIKGSGNGNSNSASGNLFSNSMAVTAGQVIYILIDNYDGTQEGFYLDFFGGIAGSGNGTTATFNCSDINQCTTCLDSDCKSYLFNSQNDYTFDETAANGACHSNFGYASTKTATVCGTFTVPAPRNTVEFPTNRGYEVITTNGANSTTCLNSANITYTVWDNCAAAPLTPNPGTYIYTGLNNTSNYKVCKTITVTGADCWLSRVCLPYWTMIENDVVCHATNLIVDAPAIAGTNAGASSDLDAGCTGYQDVYYKFIAPASGRVQVNVVPSASSNVKVSLIGAMAGLSDGKNDCNLTCNNLLESNVVAGCNDFAGNGGTERLFAFVIPGQTYYVWVSGTYNRPTANFTIEVTQTITSNANPTPGPAIVGAPDPIPANDQCTNATNLNLCVAQAGTTIGATAECTDPDPIYVDAISLENDVWYKWTAPLNNGNSEVTLTVTGVSCSAGIDGSSGIQFGIFKGTCASLVPISHGTTSLTFTPIAGQTYYFVIDGNAGAQCSFNIELKRPIVSSQTCNSTASCTGSPLNATMGITYYGSKPGTRWAYCKSSTFGVPCNTIDLDNPSTYSVYNPANGLPDPGCTPATYTFVGYILADNGVTKIPGYPTYPLPQPLTTNCTRQTNNCTFNIYPDIRNTVTVTATPCSQVVVPNTVCSPAAPIIITGNTNQTAGVGTNGIFTPVTITWNATYSAGAPVACSTYTIKNNYACPGPTGSNSCPGATLVVGATTIPSSNIGIAYNSAEDLNPTNFPWVTCDNYGKGVWFNFIAPISGNVDIKLTDVGTTDNLNPIILLFDSRQWDDNGLGTYIPQADVCSSCSDMNTVTDLALQYIGCVNNGGSNANETLQARGLNPGETYFILIDATESSNLANQNGNFSIQVVDALNGPTRPVNDNCTNAIDLSTIGCNPQPANNINATSVCSNDLFFTGASTENSVWYTYTPSVTGPHTIQYLHASGYNCYIGADPGIQFALYTSNTNNCNGAFTPVSGTEISTGTVNGSVTVTLTAGQKYYIFIDGYAGNECTFEFQIFNGNTCCTADLGVTEGGPNITLCYGDKATIGVSADPINFGENAGNNPIIGWQYSNTNPTVINPFDPANDTKTYIVGDIDTSAAGVVTKHFKDWQGYYPTTIPSYDNSTGNIPLMISGFPAGSTFNSTTDTITVCVYAASQYFADMDLDLIAPDGSVYPLINDRCTSDYGYFNVCFSNIGTATNINAAACPGAGGEIAGNYLPSGNWAGLNGEGINGNWRLRIRDDAPGGITYLLGWNIEIKKTITVKASPIPGVRHGDFTILNNDPFKYGDQVFWLTPVTFIDFDGNYLIPDSCYSYGTPVKVTLLEKLTSPNILPTCAAPGDGSNGITLTVTSPTGGMPGLSPAAVADTFTVVGSGAASAIYFPTHPVGESENSKPFTVADGQAWNVRFVDNNGCVIEIGDTYNSPDLGTLQLGSNTCDGVDVPFSISNPIPLFSQYKVLLDFDSYPQDISWYIYDNKNHIVASGGGYGVNVGANTTTTPATINPNDGPFRFVLYDGFDDGLGSGGGTNNNGGSSTINFIRVIEVHADGTVDTMFSQNYAFCNPVYCINPNSMFSQINIDLGVPKGTFATGVSVTLENNATCTGSTIANAITVNSDGTGIINTNASGVNAGSSYSLQYNYTDQYGCVQSICGPLDVFPNLTITPTIDCGANPPTVSVNAICTGCNANYVAEYSYNDGGSWTTATIANFQEIYTYAHIKNMLTGVVGCEVNSVKLADCPTVLPVEIIYIKGAAIDNKYIKISWATASELNTNRFEILRSTDAINFTKIGELLAAGNSNTLKSYFYDDLNVSAGIVYYYKVREVDNNLHSYLTNIVDVKLEKDKFNLISIYPNPTVENTVITMYSKDIIDVSLVVFNGIGEQMITEVKTMKEGLNEWNINTLQWAKGVYYFILNNGDKQLTKQVIKLQ